MDRPGILRILVLVFAILFAAVVLPLLGAAALIQYLAR